MTPDLTARRPIQPEEVADLEQLGELVRFARMTAELTMREVARDAEISVRQICRIEAGQRRTRASTLGRIADCIGPHLELGRDGLLEMFVETAGIALAPETAYPENVERRRASRTRRRKQEAAIAAYRARERRRLARESRRNAAAA